MKLLLLFLGLTLILSCTKFGKNVTLKGRVLNPVTGEGIAISGIDFQNSYSWVTVSLNDCSQKTFPLLFPPECVPSRE